MIRCFVAGPDPGYARMREAGLLNLMGNHRQIQSPYDAPVHSVPVYRMENANGVQIINRLASIEWRPHSWFYSDAKQKNPQIQQGLTRQIGDGIVYRLVGVYVKP